MGEYGGLVIDNPQDLETYLQERGPDKPFRIAYRDTGRSAPPEELAAQRAAVFRMLHDVPDVVIGLEEASQYMGPTKKEPAVEWFFQYGRHNRQSLVAIARRPSELSRIATSQSDVVVSFRQKEPIDIDYITKLSSAEKAERIRSLDDYEWDYVIDGHEDIESVLMSLCDTAEGEDDGVVRHDLGERETSGNDDDDGGGVAAVDPESESGQSSGSAIDSERVGDSGAGHPGGSAAEPPGPAVPGRRGPSRVESDSGEGDSEASSRPHRSGRSVKAQERARTLTRCRLGHFGCRKH